MGVASSYKLLSLLTPFTYTIQTLYTVHTAHIVYFVYTACTVYAVYTTYTTDTAYIAFTVHTAYTVLTALEQKKLLCLYVIWLYCFVWVAEEKAGRTNGWYRLDCCDYQSTDTIQYYNYRYSCLTHLYVYITSTCPCLYESTIFDQTPRWARHASHTLNNWNWRTGGTENKKNLPSPKPESRPRDLFRFACGHPEAL